MRSNTTLILVIGDLNSKSPGVNEHQIDQQIIKLIVSVNILVCDTGKDPIFVYGAQKPHINIIFAL